MARYQLCRRFNRLNGTWHPPRKCRLIAMPIPITIRVTAEPSYDRGLCNTTLPNEPAEPDLQNRK